ncbi:Endochitinase [Penicillium subrubescens]|uniref:chitinase n=1 Tax=Penicillium subrubescens TaxID=1316194 RepID=A0A1Q5UC35_9EURO|nr:Endochitinase [Penicillium subrubescens]
MSLSTKIVPAQLDAVQKTDGVELTKNTVVPATVLTPVTSSSNVTKILPVNQDAVRKRDIADWGLTTAALMFVSLDAIPRLNCGNKTVKHDTCDKKTATLDRVVGYYEAWSVRRPCNKFWPEQIPLGIYTHINFAFATIDPETFEVRPDRTTDLKVLSRVTALKRQDPDLKVMIALGGWTFSDPGPTQMVFSDIARSTENQKKFFASITKFLSTYDLDGVDLDWEYPEAEDRNGRPEDYKNFPTFMANLKSALDSTGRNELSITLPASYWYLQHFDIVKL